MIIDAHGHITAPFLLAKYPMPPALADIDGMLDRKAELGIDLTIVGTPVGAGTMMRLPGQDNYEQSADEVRSYNEWIGQTVHDHPGRLLAYVYTNPFGGERMLSDAAALVRESAFVGFMVNTSVRGEYLDSDKADDFFAMVAESDVPVFLHPPAEPVGSQALHDFRLVEQVARFCDVSTAVAALIFAGRLERDPSLRLVCATAGGALALVAGRLDTAYAPRHHGPPPSGPPGGGPPGGGPPIRFENRISQPPSTFLRRVYVDTANPARSGHLANLEVMGADHIVFGTDSPPLSSPLADAIDLVRGLPITDEEKDGILGENARRLFGIGNGT